MEEYVYLFVAQYFMVALRGIQNLNLVHHKVLAACCTPWCLALADVTIILFVVKLASYSVVPILGLAGMLGALTAMYGHRRFRNGKSVTTD